MSLPLIAYFFFQNLLIPNSLAHGPGCDAKKIPSKPPITLEALVYFNKDQSPGDYDYILQASVFKNGRLFHMAREAETNRLYYYADGIHAGPTLPTKQWLHVVMVYDRKPPFVRVYVNGEEHPISQPNEAVVPAGRFCRIGQFVDHSKGGEVSFELDGQVAMSRIYARVPSPAEIEKSFKSLNRSETQKAR